METRGFALPLNLLIRHLLAGESYSAEVSQAVRRELYYELREEYKLALECYSKSGSSDKVMELLMRNAELHPGTGHYDEMEPYYRQLPEREILGSPALIQAMSMLCAISMDYEGSERWYKALSDFASSRRKADMAAKEARSRLAWLVSALREQAISYPDFMKPRRQMTGPLSEAERQVLRLICADKSNAEIGELLGIKLATVKVHVSHILVKLNVSRRSEAKTAAEKLRLI